MAYLRTFLVGKVISWSVSKLIKSFKKEALYFQIQVHVLDCLFFVRLTPVSKFRKAGD